MKLLVASDGDGHWHPTTSATSGQAAREKGLGSSGLLDTWMGEPDATIGQVHNQCARPCTPKTTKCLMFPAAGCLPPWKLCRPAWLFLMKKNFCYRIFLLLSYYAKLCVHLNSLGLKLFTIIKWNYNWITNKAAKPVELKTIIIIFTILFFWNFIIAHSVIAVLPTPEQALLILPVFGRLNSPRTFLSFNQLGSLLSPNVPKLKQLWLCEAENRKILVLSFFLILFKLKHKIKFPRTWDSP